MSSKKATLSILTVVMTCLTIACSSTVASAEEDKNPIIIGSPSTKETTVSGLSSDGKIRVEIIASNPTTDKIMSIDIKFRDSSGGLKKNANYAIVATQKDNVVLSVMSAYDKEGEGMHKTIPLSSDDPVDIKVTLLGFGLQEDKMNWTGPTGEILMFNIIPEFNTTIIMVLVVGTISVIAISAKSRLNITQKF
jgi:predicted secreted protein with PEFG-CTERM motif